MNITIIYVLLAGIQALTILFSTRYTLNKIRKQLPEMKKALQDGLFHSEKLKLAVEDFDGFEKKYMFNTYLISASSFIFILSILNSSMLNSSLNPTPFLDILWPVFAAICIIFVIRALLLGKDVFEKFEELNKNKEDRN